MKKSIFVIIAFLSLSKAFSQIGWVGNMWPPSGNIAQGSGGLTIYVQVWKDGVTNSPGQGAGITCQIYYGSVSSFGGSWSNITTQNMSYNTDIGNNDEYSGTINPSPAGLYEYTCRCSDNGGSTWSWQGGGNGQLTVNAPLSVHWKNFTAENVKNKIYLKWTTASETNNVGFDIERSTDGYTWETLGFAKGQGSYSGEVSYLWKDDMPLSGSSYYRLKQRDFDGRFEYSLVRRIDLTKNNYFELSPNPFVSELRVDMAAAGYIQVTDLSGKICYAQKAEIGITTLDLSGLKQGMYILRVNTDQNNYSMPVFRQ